MLASIESISNERAYDRLANFAAIAFGDASYLPSMPDFANRTIEYISPERPNGQRGEFFDASNNVLRSRMRTLSTILTPNAPDRIMAYYEVYAALKGHKELTRIDYKKKLGDFINDIGDFRLGEITKEQIRNYRDSLTSRMKEISSVVGYMVPIKALLSHAYSEDKIPANPASGIKMPSDPKTIEDRKHLPFKPSEVLTILDAVNTVWADENNKSKLSLGRRRLYRLTIEALLHTGARPHELWRLRPENVGTHEVYNWPHRGIDIQNTKDGKRLIPCPDAALPFLDLVQAGGLEVLGAATDEQISTRIKGFSGERQFDKILKDLKIKRPRVSLYSTRATFVSALQRNGYNDTMKENIIGHVGSARMLRHYKSPEEISDMLAAMNSVNYSA